MNNSRNRQHGFVKLLILVLLGVMGVWGYAVYRSAETFSQFLTENRELKAAIDRLTREDQIGYARVVDQSMVNGQLQTTLAFFQTDREDSNRRVYQGEFVIQGDVAHFDSLVVKFDNQMVLDGDRRSIYLWRRIYDEFTPPSQGQPIEQAGEVPARYRSLLPERQIWDQLLLREDYTEQFWSSIWDLANDTEKLRDYGITAVYGNAVYTRLEPDKIYQFKINDAGQIFPQVVENW